MLIKMIFYMFFILFLSTSFAESDEFFCFELSVMSQEYFDAAGRNLNEKHRKLLGTNFATEDSQNRDRKSLVDGILSRIKKSRDSGYDLSENTLSDQELAEEIYNVAIAFGHDPKIFAAMLEVESSFRIAVIGKNGAGLAQMTSVALQELTYQYEKEDVGAIFLKLAQGYFTADEELKDWMSWIQERAPGDPAPKQTSKASSYNFKRVELPKNHRYALASGASSLKYQLAINNGHYGRALADYNSVFASYDDRILARAENISSRKKCLSNEYIEAIQKISCELSKTALECDKSSEVLINRRLIFEI